MGTEDADPATHFILMAERAFAARDAALAKQDQLRTCLELLQGQNWQLQDDEFGCEIKRRCLVALAQ